VQVSGSNEPAHSAAAVGFVKENMKSGKISSLLPAFLIQ
jgi:hypothetical protein